MPTDTQEPKGYNKQNHLTFLHGLVDDVKKEWPDENVYVDEENATVVWGSKPAKQEKKSETIGGYFDKLKEDYPWI